jgi:hypothetical protein
MIKDDRRRRSCSATFTDVQKQKVERQVRRFPTTTQELLALAAAKVSAKPVR